MVKAVAILKMRLALPNMVEAAVVGVVQVREVALYMGLAVEEAVTTQQAVLLEP